MEKTKFEQLRERHPSFVYRGYELSEKDGEILIRYDFSLENGPEFHPETRIEIKDGEKNPFSSPAAERMVFALGMVELVSYWKCACPPTVYVDCGHLDEWDIRWWKKLYFNGLGEFFYRNGISADSETFMNIVCRAENRDYPLFDYSCEELNLIAVGGGKDSAVTTELLKRYRDKNMFFTVNDQTARTMTVIRGGYGDDRILKTYRTIDKNLLDLNALGYLNGHTPFSAIVAFLSFYCAYLIGARNIVLSNESSANQSNVRGTDINHQYSKSYAFEEDFRKYTEKNIMNEIRYFSLLRPFNELQIAKYFASCPQYLDVFRSCNRGSRENRWCGKCAKCLFVFIMLSPFVDYERLTKIFGSDLLNDEDLTGDFDGLIGFKGIKPFECVGTSDEIRLALFMTGEKLKSENKELPVLLRRFFENGGNQNINKELLKEYNPAHNVPDGFLEEIKEMYELVASDN